MAATKIDPTARIFVVDDDDSARDGLQELLTSYGYRIEVFASAQDFLDRLPIAGVGCLVLDLEMPGMTGLQLQEELATRGYEIPIVFLTAHGDIPKTVTAVKRGAEDFLPKLVEEEQLLQALQRALQRSVEQQQVRQPANSLTAREREVCQYLMAGLLGKQIAHRLDISERTVKAHKAKILEKFGVASIAELVRLAERAGIEPADTRPSLP